MADITKVVITQFKADTKGYTDGTKKVETANKGAQKSTEGFTSSVDVLSDSMANGVAQFNLVPGAAGSALTAIKGLTGGFRTLKGAIAATGIGALLIAFGSLVAYFQSSEAGQARLNKIMRVFGVVVGNISDVVANFGEGLINALSDPKQLLIDIGNSIKENLINRFQAFGKIGKSIAKIFSADWREGFKELADGTIQLTTGIEDFSTKAVDAFTSAKDAMAGLVEETNKEIIAAQQLADLEYETNQIEREFWVEQAAQNQEISDLRRKARQEDQYSAEERLQFQREAIAMVDEIAAKEVDIAERRLKIRLIENSFSKSTKENLDEAARLEAEVLNVQTRRLDTVRGMERIANQLARQAEAEEKAREKAAEKELEDLDNWLVAKEEATQKALDAELKAINEKKKAEEKAAADKKKAELQAFKDAAMLSTALFDITANFAKEGSALQKSLAIAQGTMNAILAVMAVWRDPSLPTFAKIAASIAVGASMTAMLANLKSTPEQLEDGGLLYRAEGGSVPREGGVIHGRRHSQGGIKFAVGGRTVEAEAGEFIVNRVATANFLPLLDKINDTGKRNSGQPVGYMYADGGILASRVESSTSQDLRALNSDVQEALAANRPVLVTEDLDIVRGRVAITEQTATLR